MIKKWFFRCLWIVFFVALYFFSSMVANIATDVIKSLFGITSKARFMQVALLANGIQVLMIFVFAHYALKLDPPGMWLAPPRIGTSYLKGYAVGALLFGLFMVLAIATKNIAYAGRGELAPLDILLYLPGFAMQGFEEELLARGFLQRVVKDRWGVVPSIILPSLAFTALHLANHGIDVLAVLILFTVGVLFSLMVYASGSLWYAAGAHGAWNYVQGTIFGLHVSGSNYGGSWLTFDTVGSHPLFTGGEYGPEGTLFVAVILLLATVYYYKKLRKKSPDLKTL